MCLFYTNRLAIALVAPLIDILSKWRLTLAAPIVARRTQPERRSSSAYKPRMCLSCCAPFALEFANIGGLGKKRSLIACGATEIMMPAPPGENGKRPWPQLINQTPEEMGTNPKRQRTTGKTNEGKCRSREFVKRQTAALCRFITEPREAIESVVSERILCGGQPVQDVEKQIERAFDHCLLNSNNNRRAFVRRPTTRYFTPAGFSSSDEDESGDSDSFNNSSLFAGNANHISARYVRHSYMRESHPYKVVEAQYGRRLRTRMDRDACASQHGPRYCEIPGPIEAADSAMAPSWHVLNVRHVRPSTQASCQLCFSRSHRTRMW